MNNGFYGLCKYHFQFICAVIKKYAVSAVPPYPMSVPSSVLSRVSVDKAEVLVTANIGVAPRLLAGPK